MSSARSKCGTLRKPLTWRFDDSVVGQRVLNLEKRGEGRGRGREGVMEGKEGQVKREEFEP